MSPLLGAGDFLRWSRHLPPQPAPGGITWVHHTSIRMPRHPDPIVFGDWHPPAAPGFAVESGDSD